MHFMKDFLSNYRLVLFSALMFLLGGILRFLAGLPYNQAFLPAVGCIVASIAVWKYHSPFKRIRLRTFAIGLPALFLICWFFDWRSPLSWLPGLLSPLIITTLFFPRKRDLYTKLVFLSLYLGVVLCGNTAFFFLAALTGLLCLYHESLIKQRSRCERIAMTAVYLVFSSVLLILSVPNLKDSFLIWRALLLAPEMNAAGSGFWNLQVREALVFTPFFGSHMPHIAIQSHMPIVSAICSHGLWLLVLILCICSFFWFSAIRSLNNGNVFPLQHCFGTSIVLIQLFRFFTGIAGILGWRFCVTYGIPFFGYDLRDWILDAVLTGLLLATIIQSPSLFPHEVPVVKSRCAHPLRKQG